MLIAILEDDERRHQCMAHVLRELPSPIEARFFDNAPDMIEWLAGHLPEVDLIALDHDLGPNRQRDGKVFDPGTGRHVVDHLIQHPARCPVVVHTTNGQCAPGMMFALEYAGWTGFRVVPYSDLEWVSGAWLKAVQKFMP